MHKDNTIANSRDESHVNKALLHHWWNMDQIETRLIFFLVKME